MSPSDRLHHLTVNTGHVATTTRADVSPLVIDRLVPLIDAEGGPVPGMPGVSLDLRRPLDPTTRRPIPGGAFFQIDPPGAGQGSKTPAVMAVACWRPAMAAGAWAQLGEVTGGLASWLGPLPLPARPPGAPWLAVVILPWISSMSPADQAALGDLERCLFWALVDSE